MRSPPDRPRLGLFKELDAALKARFEAAGASAGTPAGRLEAACAAYLQFARERPELFRLIFVSNTNWELELKVHTSQAMGAFPVFESLVSATMLQADAQGVNARALAVWAAVHGMALLKINGRFERRYVQEQTDEQVIKAILNPEPMR